MNPKIFNLPQLTAWIAAQRSLGRKIGFTCGSFDILHAGHVDYLARAREHCDCLVVAVNSDSSIRSYKNPLRPVNQEEHRAAVVAALQAVDAVIVMHESRPAALIQILKPDVYIKGGDYSADRLQSKPIVESYGGEVVCIPVNFAVSTSDILERAAAIALHAKPPVRLPAGKEPRLLFLDRDGTLIRDIPFLHDSSRVELLPGVLEGLEMLQRMGFTLVLVTNQQGIGLGYFAEDRFIEVNRRLLRLLGQAGIGISRIYYCPHSHAEACLCRKPGSLLLENALRYYGAKPERCYLIGDSLADCQAAQRIGVPSVLIADNISEGDCAYKARSFLEAAHWIIDSEAPAAMSETPAAIKT